MIIKFGEKEYGMDGYLFRNISSVKAMIAKDDDCVIVVDGRERTGKSVLAMQVACALDPTMTLDRVTFSPQEFKDAIFKAEKYQCVILDEAMEVFYGKESQSWVNKFFNKLLAKIGQKNLITILVLPSYFELDKYPALHRSRILLHVYSKKKLRGRFAFFNYTKKLQLYIAGKKFYDYKKTRPNFRGKFGNFYPLDEQEYRKKKANSLNADAEDIGDTSKKQQRDYALGLLNRFMSVRDIVAEFQKCNYPLQLGVIGDVIAKYNKGEKNGKGKRIGTDSNETGGDSEDPTGEVEGTGREDREV